MAEGWMAHELKKKGIYLQVSDNDQVLLPEVSAWHQFLYQTVTVLHYHVSF